MTRVFIDGSSGTTGLRIHERLAARDDLRLIILPDEKRKDPDSIRRAFREADIAFLCLPDDAAREAVQLAEGSGCRIIDTSTAHRTAPGWVYGFPELKGQRELIADAQLVANPGCHASGFIALAAPLVAEGLLSKDTALTCISITGYSGGGKKMIADYADPKRQGQLEAPRVYGLTQRHKHLAEMKRLCGLDTDPAFYPIVSDYYAGMETNIPVLAMELKGTMEDVRKLYRELYAGPVVHYEDCLDDGGFISSGLYAGRDDMAVSIYGNDERMTLVALFDNLGKGASGAAIQNMNIMLGADETKGLNLEPV